MPSVQLSDGATLAYASAGRGSAVLCLQGVGVVGEGWRPQLDGLADEFLLLAPDNRGIGASSPVTGEVSVEQYAADALALLDALDIERAHVIGHSLGGVIAQQLALDAPTRVRSLSLLCTFARAKDGARVTWRSAWVGLRMYLGTPRMRRAAFLSNVLSEDELRAADIDELHARLSPYFGRDLATTPAIVMKQVGALRRHDTFARLGELAGVPTLVLSGAHDRVAPPAQGRALAAAIPGARLVVFEDAAHGLPLTQIERTNALLREHLRAGQSA